MELLEISPQKILAHIRMICDTEMEDLPTLSRAVNAPLYGYVVGDEPPPPPRTKVEYYFNSTANMACPFTGRSTFQQSLEQTTMVL